MAGELVEVAVVPGRYPAAERPAHPVLFYNPKSGDGKAERLHLADEARRRGIEPIELQRGDDLEELVRRALKQGADALAMAGGDDSQAIVAMIAAELDLPYACIPAGTRNHYALDLDIDRDDVVGALDAFVNGGERRVDLAEVNCRVFVTNVSLGLYADAVQRRDIARRSCTRCWTPFPPCSGRKQRRRTCDGTVRAARNPVAILVSNNAHRLGRALGSGTRPRLDRGLLGITVLAPMAASAHGSARRRLAMQQGTAPEFQIDSDGPAAAGIDGEAMHLDPPAALPHPAQGTARQDRAAPPGASPSALEPDTAWQTIEALASFALHRGETELAEIR